MRCADCAHFGPIFESYDVGPLDVGGFGSCERWRYGYRIKLTSLKPNDAVVESDEGWCNVVGPEFGCVLFEARQ